MKKKTKNKKVLIGSISLVSAIVIVTASLGPSFFIGTIDLKDTAIKNTDNNYDIIVPDNYKYIQEAVDAAKPGDTIFIRSGTYRGSSRFINTIEIKKDNLKIFGEDKNNTFIDGRNTKCVFSVEADYVHISDLTIKNNDINGTLILLNSDHCTISNNNLIIRDYSDGREYGIEMFTADYNNISNNNITGADYGISVKGSINNIIEKNEIYDNHVGFDLSNVIQILLSKKTNIRDSTDNIISKNHFYDNLGGVRISCPENYIVNNHFEDDLTLSRCSNNHVINNLFYLEGLIIYGLDKKEFFHDIQGNLVNDKPLYYYYFQYDVVVPSDAGQIIIADCNQVTISGTKISKNSCCVYVAFSTNVRISENEFSYSSIGVFLYYSINCYIYKNNFIKNMRDAGFVSKGFFSSKKNSWSRNYWDSWLGAKRIIFKLTPKNILGTFTLNRPFKILNIPQFRIPIRNVDRRPAKVPYSY